MDQASYYYRTRKTCMEMLRDRGYLITEEDINMSKDIFKEKFGADPRKAELMIYTQKQDDPQDAILVFYPEGDTVGIKTIQNMITKMQENGVKRAIMVINKNMTHFARSALQDVMVQEQLTIEQFREEELLVNITHHVLVPQHNVLRAEEKKALLDRYKVKDTQLPRIQFTDPIARYYGMKRGEVVRIVRDSETAGRYVTYRQCV